MNSAPNRERYIPRASDSPGVRVQHGHRVGGKEYPRFGHLRKQHGKIKPKGQHAYRRGLA